MSHVYAIAATETDILDHAVTVGDIVAWLIILVVALVASFLVYLLATLAGGGK